MNSLIVISAILLLLLIVGGNCFAQTTVCGFQPGARFTLAGSPYKLTCTYDIPVGDSLVVEPGVRLDLNGQRITVNGRLRLHGTPQDSVFLTSSVGLSYSFGVYIPGSGTGSLTYVSFRGLTNGTALYMEDGAAARVLPAVVNCRFAGNAIDIQTGPKTTAGLHNLTVRPVRLLTAPPTGGRLAAYGPVSAYMLQSIIDIPTTDSLVVEPGVRLDLNGQRITANGQLRLHGTPQDSVFLTSSVGLSYSFGVYIPGNGTGSLTYVSLRGLTNGTALYMEDGVATRAVPVVSNCRFASNTIDIQTGPKTTTGLHNLAVRPVRLLTASPTGGRLSAYGPVSAYVLQSIVDIPTTDSLVVEPKVRLDLNGQRITVNGRLRLHGTPQDSVFLTSSVGLSYSFGVYIPGSGTGSLTYVSFQSLTNGTALYMEDGAATRVVPVVANCRFAGNTIDIQTGPKTTTGLRNLAVRPVRLLTASPTGGRLSAYGPVSAYMLQSIVEIPASDSLVVEPKVRLDLAGQRITANGRLRLHGTQQDSIFLTSSVGLSYSFGIYIPGSGTGSLTYVSFRGLTNGTALYLENSVGLNVRNCFFSGGAGVAINIPSTQTLRLSDLNFANFQTAMAVTTGNVTVANTLFNGLTPRFGINATGTSSVVAINCNFGHPSGPYNLLRNPTGLGCQISNNVCLSTGTTPVAGFDFVINGNDVAFINTSANASSYSWNFGNSSISTLANPLKTLPIGTYNVCLTAGSSPLACASASFCKTVSILGVASIETNHGGNNGAVSVVVKGGGFVPNMQLVLRRLGEADIPGDTVITRSPGVITTGFNLTGKTIGQWDVVATYPNGTSATLPNGFTIEAGTAGGLWVNLTGDGILRIGFRQVYTLTYGNAGNTDAVGVPLLIDGLPGGTTIELLDSLFRVNQLPSYNNLMLVPYDSLKYTVLDSVTNTSFRTLMLRKIAAGSVGTLSFIFRLPNSNALLHTYPVIKARLFAPEFTSVSGLHRPPSAADIAECNEAGLDLAHDIVFGLLSATDWLQCANGLRGAAKAIHQTFAKGSDSRGVMDGIGVGWATASTIANCTVAAGSLLPAGKVAKAIVEAAKIVKAFQDGAEPYMATAQLINACKDAYFPEDEAPLQPIVGNAWDPNTKYGPGGGSWHHYITKNRPLGYSINFENAPTANLNAQTVRVTDTLSTQAFDRTTFAFTSVTIGEKTYALPTPAKSFVHDFDFVSQYGVKARVIGTFDVATGIARWTIFSIDPVTNQVTTNALAGFLPPDLISPRGQGYVSFIVRANAARQTGDIIRNRASIIFDYNPPILTNAWQNTFDLVKPVSSVTSVLPTAANTVSSVTWTGTDVGSGIQSYDIWYTTNSRNPRKWLSSTSLITSLFTGRPDSTYCFYSIARDSAGNVQAAPVLPAVCRSITTGTLASVQIQDNFKVFPNPSTGKFTLESYCQKSENTVLEIGNVLGSIVYQKQVKLNAGTQSREVDISNLPTGVYFLRLKTSEGSIVKKLIKE